MLIANPIYDVVFKRMMENEKVAKFFIGTLLNQNIEHIEVKPQEFTYADELVGLAVFRLDYIATLKTEDGTFKKILIEIQKARNYIDLMRFRNYLAEQYKKEDEIEGQKEVLPITTIYILGFTLPEVDAPCIKVERQYKDLVNGGIIEAKSDFIEKLTHDSYIVQVERITDRFQTELDKLLSLFEQSHFTDDKKVVKEFKHQPDNEALKLTTDILHHAGTNPKERKQLEIEQEAWRTINAMFSNQHQALATALKALSDSRKELIAKEKAMEDKDKALEDMKRELEALKRKLD
jgi:hypothetical protein